MAKNGEESPVRKRNMDGEMANAAMRAQTDETIRRFGSAVSEHFAAYAGRDHKARTTHATLKSLAGQKQAAGPYKNIQTNQQAGFAAEIKSVARRNAKAIIDGSGARYIREDDRTGKANDPLVDISRVDPHGRTVSGGAEQMKFVGSSPEDLLGRLKSKAYRRYFDAGLTMSIADDDYDALMGHNGKPGIIDQQIDELKRRLAVSSEDGKATIRDKIDELRTIKSRLKASGLTREEAREAVRHPKWSTTKDVVGTAHAAGVEQALNVALVTGAMSLVREFVAYTKGEESLQEAAGNVGKTVGIASAFGYATGFAGSAIKGAMQNSTSGYMRSISETNVAAGMAMAATEVMKTVTRLCQGRITPEQCVEELGEKGVAQIGSLMGAAVASGTASAAGMGTLTTMALSVAGSTVGYSAAVAVYRELSTALKDYELAREDRIRVERECAEAIESIRAYRAEMDALTRQYFERSYASFEIGFKAMDQAIIDHDPDGYIIGNTAICEALGRTPQFRDMNEFDDLMASDENLKL